MLWALIDEQFMGNDSPGLDTDDLVLVESENIPEVGWVIPGETGDSEVVGIEYGGYCAIQNGELYNIDGIVYVRYP